jgi:hypothetical protein
MVRTRWYLGESLEPQGGVTAKRVEATIIASFFILTAILLFLLRARENALGLYDSCDASRLARLPAKGE